MRVLVDAGASNLTELAKQALSGGHAADAVRLAGEGPAITP